MPFTQEQLAAKQANLAKQEKMIEEGNRKHAQMEADIYSGAGEDFQRKFFNMTRTERQMYGLKMKSYGKGTNFIHRKRKNPWKSLCCKKEAIEYKATFFQGNIERFFRCSWCGKDCEATQTKPRKKKEHRTS